MAVYKNERGSWNYKCYYTTWDGKYKQRKREGFKTRKEAVAKEAEFLNSCKTDITITFSNLAASYLEDSKARVKPTTYETKENMIRTKLLPYFGDFSIASIDTITVRKWQNEIIAGNYKPTYQKVIHNQLSAILNYAIKYYGLQSNAAAKCGSIGKKKSDNIQFWTLEEFRQFIQSVENNPTTKTIFYLLFFSGMREGELLALTLGDFDFEANTVDINKTYARIKGQTIIQEPKTPKSKRKIVLPKFIMDMIKDYANQLYAYKSTERLFNVAKNYLHRAMTKYSNISGVKRIRIHDLRHSHASMLIELNISPLAISERLGHEDVQTTLNVYSHLYPNKQNEIANTLESLAI